MTGNLPILELSYRKLQGLYGGTSAPQWDAALECFVIMDPNIVRETLRSDAFAVRQHDEDLDAIQHAKGLDLGATIAFIKNSPLSNNGEAHRELKKQASQYLLQVANPALDAFEKTATSLVPQLLESKEPFDLVTDLVAPLATSLFSGLSGLPETDFEPNTPAARCLTQLLSVNKQAFSPQRLQAIDGHIRERQQIVTGSDFERSLKLSFSTGTFELFKSAMANSLIFIIGRGAGRPICEIDFEAQLPVTSVPFVDRVCVRDVEVAGTPIHQNDKLVLLLGALSRAPNSHNGYFGTGPHICIGKVITERAWSVLRKILLERKECLCLKDVKYRDFDFALLAPVSAAVEVLR